MKCPTCNRDMAYFIAGRQGTVIQQWSEYVCIKCKISIDNDGKEPGVINYRKLKEVRF